MDPRNKGPIQYLSEEHLKNALIRQPLNENPLQLNEFRFVLHRIPNTVYMCQSANLPGIKAGENFQPSPFSVKIRRVGTSFDQGDLVLKFIVNENMSNWMEIRNWMRTQTGETGFEQNSWEGQKYSDATLILMNSASKPFIKASFHRCFPILLGGIDFSSTVTDIAPATCDVTFAYTGYEVEYINAG